MGLQKSGLGRFISNKNTMTILLVVVGIAVLYVVYNIRVESAVKPVTVPVALKSISATSQITESDIKFVSINSDFLDGTDIIISSQSVINKYVTTGTSIVEGSLFHKSQVVEKSELPNAVFDDIPDGYTLFPLTVSENSTYGNSIYPGDRIDLYVTVPNDAGIVLFGKLIESIEVLAVRDSSFNDVFGSTDTGKSALLLFAVPNESFSLLKRAEEVSGLSIIPVPRNKNYTTEGGATNVASYEIKNLIDNYTKDAD